MTDIRARLADTLWNHYDYSHIHDRCECKTEGFGGDRGHCDHVADVLLSLPGIAIVDREAFDRLHRPNTSAFSGKDRCLGCGYAWPCPTIALLAAANAAEEKHG